MKLKTVWLPLLVIIFFVIMVNLGFWQLRRYHDKQQLLLHYQRNLQLPELTWRAFTATPDKLFRRVHVTGHYLNQKTLLLDNRWHADQLGYEVLTPFKPEHAENFLVVNRGWIPAGKNRQKLPVLQAILGRQVITGYIDQPNKKGFMLGNNIEEASGGWPLRIQQIQLVDIAKATDMHFYPYIFRLDPSAAHGFVRQWQLVTMPPLRHLGYAVQWFSLSLALIIAYAIFFRYRRRQKRGEDA